MVQAAAADKVFHALSNPTRRKVIELLSVGPATVSELAAPFDMQLPSFVQHLSVLEKSHLVKSKKRGRSSSTSRSTNTIASTRSSEPAMTW